MSESAVKSRKFSCRWFVLASTKHCSLLFKLKFNQVLPSAFYSSTSVKRYSFLLNLKSELTIVLLSSCCKEKNLSQNFWAHTISECKTFSTTGRIYSVNYFLKSNSDMSLSKAKQSCLFLMWYAKMFFILYNEVSSWWDLQKCFIYLMSCTLVSPPTTNRSVVWRSKLATKLRNNSTFLSPIGNWGIIQHFFHWSYI